MDRMLRFALLKVVFLGAVVDPHSANMAAFCFWAAVTGLMKCFVGLARDRCETLLSSPSASLWQHIRVTALLLAILINDSAWIAAGIRLGAGASVGSWALLWLFDAACVLIEGICAFVRYAVQGAERWRTMPFVSYWACDHTNSSGIANSDAGDNDNAARNLLYTLDLAADMLLNVLNLAHYAHILRIRGGPRMQLIDIALLLDIRFLLLGAWRRAEGHLKYLELTRRLRDCFPDADPSELIKEEGVTCAICMESMRSAKVLPCGHIYHLGCLRDYLQHGSESVNYTCPLCRQDLMMDEGNVQAGREARGWFGQTRNVLSGRRTTGPSAATRGRQAWMHSHPLLPRGHLELDFMDDDEDDDSTETGNLGGVWDHDRTPEFDNEAWTALIESMISDEESEDEDWNTGMYTYTIDTTVVNRPGGRRGKTKRNKSTKNEVAHRPVTRSMLRNSR